MKGNTFWKHPITVGIIASIIASMIIWLCQNLYYTHFSLKTTVDGLISQMDILSKDIRELKKDIRELKDASIRMTDHFNTIDDHLVNRPDEGIACKVGLNSLNTGYVASVYSDNPYGLKTHHFITMFNKTGESGRFVTVVISMEPGLKKSDDTADIYLSEACFEALGIDPVFARKKGVHNMTFKLAKTH